MKILDATCGMKGIWYQKNHPFVTFMDKRKGQFDMKVDNPNISFKARRITKVMPDVISEWKDTPFPDNYFDMVIFDPPHLILERGKKMPALVNRYGCLYKDDYKKVLKEGIKKLFDVLKPEGIFIFKWCENSAKTEDIIKLFPYKPMFGSNTKSKGHTANFWILFIKYNRDDLERFINS